MLAKQKVWIALGALYLDTEIDHQAIARELLKSQFSIEEIEKILFDEVHPVLYPNLLSVAGEWTGWNDAWLTESIQSEISSRQKKDWRSKLSRLSSWLPKRWVRSLLQEDWNQIKKIISSNA